MPLLNEVKPFLKWAGGKRRLLPELRQLLPADVAHLRHVEPFLGGGALFFAMAPQRALLADINERLIGTYASVRDEVENVIAHLRDLEARYGTALFYDIRSRYNARAEACSAEAAAWFIYLNKSCFNGLYRVNRAGAFNVPCGRYKVPRVLDEPALRAASKCLAGVPLTAANFEATLASVAAGDFVYLDPPYEPASATANFCAYAAAGFCRDQHQALASLFADLAGRGARVMLSNSDMPFTRQLYRAWHIQQVHVRRSVSCAVQARRSVSELVVTSYPPTAALRF